MLTHLRSLVTIFLLLAIATATSFAAPPGSCSLELELDPAARGWNAQYIEWLAVSPSTGLLARRLQVPLVSAVELRDAEGTVPTNWGLQHDTLLVEPRRAFAGTLAVLRVAYVGDWADSGAGPSRDAAGRTAHLPRLDARVAPMQADAGEQRWELVVHVPGTHRARSNLPVTGMSRTGSWWTWTYRAGGAVSLDSARVRIEPATKAVPKRAKRRR
ncbi:MAG: hypothetical protein U0704_10960 [Candidatus Eisenbacteria bacterium]